MHYFSGCQSVEEAKKRYRALLKEHHPDISGQEGEAVTVEVIAQFNAFLNGFMSQSFNAYYEEMGWEQNQETVTPFQEILRAIISLDCEIEIIGFWIYCFNSYAVRVKLKELGFWFSSKHKAWVYSGKDKRSINSKDTLDEIRAKKGSQKVKRAGQVHIAGVVF